MKITLLSFSLSFCLMSTAATPCLAKEGGKAPAPIEELEQLDKRVPVPMPPHMALHQKQNMREHLEAIRDIVSALEKKDFKKVEAGALRMGYSEEMAQMCQRMGAGAAGYTEIAIRFHKTADEIAVHARKHNEKEVLDSLHRTLVQCTSCHAIYRQQVVDEATYNTLGKKLKSE